MTADDELRRDLARTIADAIDPEMDDDPFDAAADAILRAFRVERRGEPERDEPKLDDVCECGHTFGHHCTPDEPNGGHCAASETAFRGYACSCMTFRARGEREPTPPAAGLTYEKANPIITRALDEANMSRTSWRNDVRLRLLNELGILIGEAHVAAGESPNPANETPSPARD